jgi:ATP-dependent DNA helicase DinG
VSTDEPRWKVPEGLTPDGVLGRDGALSSVLPGYECRPQQLEMARAVEKALAEKRFLLAEAGTGTGKTLAYLVPALLSGKRVVISTATRTLQEQIFVKDLPLLRDEVGLEVKAAILKGRSNYLCAARFERFDSFPLFPTPAEAEHWDSFREWAMQTQTGDRGESNVPDDWGTWLQVSTTPDSCTGGKCPFYESCFVTRARRAASECQLIVVNHALFFADLSLKARGEELELGVLPAYDAVVFDEAHALEDVATEYFGQTVSSGRLIALVNDVLERTPKTHMHSATLTALAMELRGRTEDFFDKVRNTLRLEGATENATAPAGVESDARLLPHSLDETAGEARLVEETLGAMAALCPEDDADLGGIHRRTLESALALEATMRADDPDQVYWASARGRSVQLRAAPIDVGASLAAALYDSVDSVIFTSATLQAGGGFNYVLERLGLTGRATDTMQADSPFDYQRQALLYVPGYLPPPADPEWTVKFAREVFRLLTMSGGRAFVLFTSYKHMEAVHALVAPHLKLPVLKQGEAPRRALLERFTEEPSVLFATQSFWEGVDVPGSALSMVIIDRLPFAPPNEPLQAARMDAVRERGGKPFDEYQVPQAALALRQGFGRLIRTARDFGVVAIGDSRIVTKRYGKRFLESLPPVPMTMLFDEVRAFWQNAPHHHE